MHLKSKNASYLKKIKGNTKFGAYQICSKVSFPV